jgi:diguanylate cyclase (GGDEF)-like protein
MPFNILRNRSYKFVWRVSVSMVLLLTGFVAVFGDVIIFEPFYAIPVVLASWYGTRKSGILLALFSFLLLVLAKLLAMHDLAGFQIYLFGGLAHAIAYMLLAIIVTSFRNVHRIEVIAADTDSLTGIGNSRSFYSDLAHELERSLRYERVFSLAYLDIDDFKHINDSRGHLEGDRLLVEVASCLKANLRKTDITARIGGDEFACLFPETGQTEAKTAFEKAIDLLQSNMMEHGWPVTFSAGLVTFDSQPEDIEEALHIADELMYSVKNGKKNNIAYKVWKGK